jgi:hypothetical protein
MMNTTSFVLNGKSAAYIHSLPKSYERAAGSGTTTVHGVDQRYKRQHRDYTGPDSQYDRTIDTADENMSFTWTIPPSTETKTTTVAPSRPSSPGWYNREGELTLEDFARKLNTRGKRFEVWVGKCAQNFVMALFSPTPLVLFLFNPISLMLWMILGLWMWFGGRSV